MSIIDQLTNVYYTKENWHKNYLSKEDADAYHERLLVNGNIITFIQQETLIGYIEYWRITPEQLGRIIIGDPILTDVEDILTGPIAYINNMYIDEGFRNGDAFNMLGTMFLNKNRDAEYFVATRNLKHHKPVQVYKREDLIRLYTKGL